MIWETFALCSKHARLYVSRMLKETGLALEVRGAFFEGDISYKEKLNRHKRFVPIFDI